MNIIEILYLEKTNNGIHLSPQSSTSSSDSQPIESLQEEVESLENQLRDNRSSIDLLKNNLQLITQENEQLKQQNHEIEERYDRLMKEIHVLTPVQSTHTDETEQLQAHISLLTTRCSQLDQANHAWEEFHRNQLESFREKLQDLIPIDSNSSLEQIAQEILDQSSKILLFFSHLNLSKYAFRFSKKTITNLSIK